MPFDLTFVFHPQESGVYAIGCKSYTLLLDSRTLQSVKKITSRYNGCGIRSASFRGDMLTIGTGLGRIFPGEARDLIPVFLNTGIKNIGINYRYSCIKYR